MHCVALQSRGTIKTCPETLAVYNTTCTVWHCYLQVNFLAKPHTATRTAANLPHPFAADIYGS